MPNDGCCRHMRGKDYISVFNLELYCQSRRSEAT